MALLAVLFASCSTSGGSGSGGAPAAAENAPEAKETPTPGGSLVIGLKSETNGWNPATAQWADDGTMVGSSFMEPLMIIDKDGKFVPYLAESVTPNEKADVWTIKIKPNITFHDGTALTADVVKANLDFYRSNPKALSALAQKGMFNQIVVKDPLTVEVQLAQPWGAYPTAIAAGSGWMMAESMLRDPDGTADKPVGTGPFKFDKWVRDSNVVVKKFDKYWGKDDEGRQLPYLDSIEYRVIIDGGARAGSLRTGDLDVMMSTNATDPDALGADFTVVKDYTSEQTFVQLNSGETPFNNIHARKAVAYATDRGTVAGQFGTNLNQSNSPFPASTPWGKATSSTPMLGFDVAKAKEELELYKQETGSPELRFKLTTLPDLSYQTMAQQLQSQWKGAGIAADLDTVEQTAFITRLVTGDTTGTLMRNYGYLDPDSDYYFFHKKMAQGKGALNINFTQIKDDALSQAFDDGRQNIDPAKRQAAYEKAAKSINDNVINIWLFNTPHAFFAKKTVRGFNPARDTGFGNFQPKTWIRALWKQH